MKLAFRILLGVSIAATALVATLAMPVERWRTGQLPAPELPLVQRGPPLPMAERLWIDTDAACGAGARVDADDCFALILLARSGRPIAGISAVQGNADVDTVMATLQRLRGALAGEGLTLVVPMPGAHAERSGNASAPTLEEALRSGPLSIVALGPLTNIAATLGQHPELVRNVTSVIAVVGRRKGHLFHPTEGRGGGMLLGHGPVFRDFNVATDPQAVLGLLALGVPLAFIPYEAARDIVLGEKDLQRLAAGKPASRWAAAQAADWLGYWKADVGIEGFYPFDALAALYVVEPQQFDCARARAWIESPRRLLARIGFRATLYVGLEREVPPDARASAEVLYCPRVRPTAHAALMARLSGDALRN